jgi:hypothetical protein
MLRVTLQEMVAESLGNALENGCHDFVLTEPPEAVADDLKDYCDLFEDVAPEAMIPIIRKWQEERR